MRTPSLTEVVGLIMNLISGTHNFRERREYAFNVLPEYNIITHSIVPLKYQAPQPINMSLVN